MTVRSWILALKSRHKVSIGLLWPRSAKVISQGSFGSKRFGPEGPIDSCLDSSRPSAERLRGSSTSHPPRQSAPNQLPVVSFLSIILTICNVHGMLSLAEWPLNYTTISHVQPRVWQRPTSVCHTFGKLTISNHEKTAPSSSPPAPATPCDWTLEKSAAPQACSAFVPACQAWQRNAKHQTNW